MTRFAGCQAVVFCLASKMEVLCARFSFVFKKLLFHLDDQHLVMLKEASRQMSNHIDDERYYWIRIIQKLFAKHNGCTEEFPESWKKVIGKTPIKTIRQLAMITRNFIKNPSPVRAWKEETSQWHPLHVVAEQGHLQLLNYVIEKTGDNNPKLAKGMYLHFANHLPHFV